MTSLKNKGGKMKIIISSLLIILGLGLFFHQSLMGLVSNADIEVKIEHAPSVMPAAYKVYANEDALEGKYSLFKMLVTNTGKSTARNIEVSYDIPGYVTSRSIEKIPVLLPGQSVLVNCYPSFNQNIVEKTTPSKERVNIHVSGANIEPIEESFAIEIKGRNELVYTFIPFDEIRSPGEFFDNSYLVSCFVTPEDPIIKYYTQKIQEKVLKGETAAVTNTEQEAIRFLMGLYNATLLSHMVYSGTSGVPSTKDGVSSITQSVRLPREVVTGKTGLCIELSILYASVLMNAGLDPIIFFEPGHAYPGFRLNGKFYAIESTGIGGEGMQSIISAEQALQVGMKKLEEFMKGAQMGNDAYSLLDVREAIRKGALAMELKDDSYLRLKIDEIAQAFEPMQVATNVSNPPTYGGNPNTGGGGGEQPGGTGGGDTPAGYTRYNGGISVAYPSSWQSVPRNEYTMPQKVRAYANNSMEAYLEIYQFPGVNDPGQAMMMMQQHVGTYGAQLQYTPAGESGNFTVFQGATYSGNNSIEWIAAFKRSGGGLSAVAVGSIGGTSATYKNTITNILNSLR